MSDNNSKIENTTVVILAGGLGSRISDVKKRIPKCLVEIGGKPIIYHIIKYFQFYGFKNFIICTGFKSKEVEKYFQKTNKLKTFKGVKINTVFTGLNSNTGLRIKKIEKHIKDNFFLTYCDGLTNLNLRKLFHLFLKEKKMGIMTAVNPRSRFGIISIQGEKNIFSFDEKSLIKNLWVNAGFYIFKKKIFNYIPSKDSIFESHILPKVAKKKLLISFKHRGFWKCMDTIKDKNELNDLWFDSKPTPWKIW
ncbi:sugar phosphate nucleotidyltransferase [Candidatus Pelagibacter sp.]|nr:sugar phosphate nucleotidyltransferase [Candidatus Pelagibacter sp.]